MPITFKRFSTGNALLEKLQDNIDFALTPLGMVEIIDRGVFHTGDGQGIALSAAGITQVAHKLGREPRGWWPVSPNADARIWEDPGANALRDRFLNLRCSADVTIRLYVF